MSDLGVSISEQLITDLKKKKLKMEIKEEVVSFFEEQFKKTTTILCLKKN